MSIHLVRSGLILGLATFWSLGAVFAYAQEPQSDDNRQVVPAEADEIPDEASTEAAADVSEGAASGENGDAPLREMTADELRDAELEAEKEAERSRS